MTLTIALLILAQSALPEGPGKLTTARVCNSCHGAEMYSGIHKSQPEWEHTITAMTTEKGVEISDTDFAAVLKYLSTNLGPGINVNKASAADLEKGLGLSPATAAAIVQYREKNGPFKDVEALKKVEGIDAAVLEARKNGLSF